MKNSDCAQTNLCYLTIINDKRRDLSIFSVCVLDWEHIIDIQSGFRLERHSVVVRVDSHGMNNQLDMLSILKVIHLH